MVFIGVDLDQIDKMVPRRVKSAPGAIELNQHFGAETDLLDLECIYAPKWRETKWSKVPCLRKQHNGRGSNPRPPDPEFGELTARPHTAPQEPPSV